MYFNSFSFAVFFPTVLGLYWILPFRFQNPMLLAASYIFYGFWNWKFLTLIIISTTVDFIAGIKIDHYNQIKEERSEKLRVRWLCLSVCINLGMLGFFKYFNFFSESLKELLNSFGANPDWFYLEVVLPVGISFYTFQTLSYTIDIYRRQLRPTRHFLDFALYVAFFPQLVAGPIERARSLLPRISNPRKFDKSQFSEGIHLILQGLFKKVFIADNLGLIVDRIFLLPNPSGFEVMIAGWAFAFQVYGDFSGYSDIARGCAKCLGIELMLNFNHPYIAINPSERWKRWHISLSTWLRDYVYIPLGGNRKGRVRTYGNLMATMLLGGLWHGAGWNFVLWGAWEGLMLSAYRFFKPFIHYLAFLRGLFPRVFIRFLQIFIMYNLVSIGLIIFRGQSLSHIFKMLHNLLIWEGHADVTLLFALFKYSLPLVVYEFLQYKISKDEYDKLQAVPVYLRSAAYGVIFYLFAFHGAAARSFIYFQF
jgi:D-alanyl-lipoteichoic acid acyltransferase DltB (MBOAT superfamily)